MMFDRLTTTLDGFISMDETQELRPMVQRFVRLNRCDDNTYRSVEDDIFFSRWATHAPCSIRSSRVKDPLCLPID